MITIKEIAEMAGVSIGTVDRVLHNRKGVAEETREKVLKIVKENDYKTNPIARNLVMSKIYRIAVMMPFPEQDNEYWAIPLGGIQKAFRELNYYKFIPLYYFYHKYKSDSFYEQWKELIKEIPHLDGLILSPNFSGAMEELITQLPEKFPYLFFDSYIPNGKELTYIGQDAFQSGMLAAYLFSLIYKTGKKIAVFRILPIDFHLEDRINGFKNFFYDSSQLLLIDFDKSHEDSELIKIKKILEENKKNLSGVFIPHADCSFLSKLFSSMIFEEKPKVIAYDLTDSNRKLLEEGIIEFLICQRSFQQGYSSVKLLFDYLVLDKKISRKVNLPIDIITKYNFHDYVGI